MQFLWYLKRFAIAGIYIQTELFMLSDKSNGYEETWEFLHNLVEKAVNVRSFVKDASLIFSFLKPK